ncbi:ATP synthase subunit B family protein [Echinicola marina]|uniref:hypothetical protein n=1 Tax=Echinicola marina TaxID=2859768 RepID=UPI001CF656EA|nr:hypothetical protein [Echinicola marina]
MPRHTEVLVSSLTCEEVITRLHTVTQEVDYLSQTSLESIDGQIFNGSIKEDSFRLSKVLTKADSFIPLIKGKIEPTGSGCIIFLDFSLFPGSAFFIIFWSVITLAMGIFFVFAADRPLLAILSLAVGLGNILFAWSYFKRKVKESQKIFHEMLSLQKNS